MRTVALIVGCFLPTLVQAAPIPKEKPPQVPERPSEKIVEAWQNAGAYMVWYELRGTQTVSHILEEEPQVGWWLKIDVLAKTNERFSQLTEPPCSFDLRFLNDRADDGLFQKLPTFRNMQVLEVTTCPCQAGARDIAALKRQVGLRELRLSDLNFDLEMTKALASLTQLDRLDINRSNITDELLYELRHLQFLKSLNLWSASTISDKGLQHLAHLGKLEELNLEVTAISDTGATELAKIKSLRKLRLSHTKIGDAGLKAVSELEQLEEISLRSNRITDEGIKHLLRLKNLKILDVSWTRLTSDALKSIGKLTSLQSLSLSGRDLTDAGIGELSGLTNLEQLSLAKTQLTDLAMKTVAKFKKLKQLDISGNMLTRDCIDDLSELTNIKELEWNGNKIDEAGMGPIFRTILANRKK